jgi:RNA-directed DNA polymerase
MGCKDALRRVDELLKTGHVHVVDADLKSFFDTIPKDRLLAEVGRKVADGRVLGLVRVFLDQSVLDGDLDWIPEQGTPPTFAGMGYEMLRYADDCVPRRH